MYFSFFEPCLTFFAQKKAGNYLFLLSAIFDVYVLDFSVRDGKRYFHVAIITIKLFFFCNLFILTNIFIMFFKNMIMLLYFINIFVGIIIKIKSSCY